MAIIGIGQENQRLEGSEEKLQCFFSSSLPSIQLMSTRGETQAHKIWPDVYSQPSYYTDALPISYLFNHTVNTLPFKMKNWGIETHVSWVNPESSPSFLPYSLRVGKNPMKISGPAFLFSSFLYISLLCLSFKTPFLVGLFYPSLIISNNNICLML